MRVLLEGGDGSSGSTEHVAGGVKGLHVEGGVVGEAGRRGYGRSPVAV